MSFRSRLALAAALAVAVAVVAASVTTYFLVRSELRAEVDRSLQERAEVVRAIPTRAIARSVEGNRRGRRRGPRGRELLRGVPPPRLGGAAGIVQIVSADGAVIGTTTLSDEGGDAAAVGEGQRALEQQTVSLPVSDRALEVARGAPRFFEDAELESTPLRLLTVPLGEGLALQVGRPLSEVNDVMGRLGWILLILSLAGVALAGALGLAVARAALVPVRRLTRTAEAITETRDLSHLIDVKGNDEVSRLARSFNTMLGALEESLSAQRQLVADASHELRTPLTSMRTNIELLARDDLPGEKRQAMLADVTAQLEELSALVTDVVDLARGEESHQAQTDVRLDELVVSALERARRHAPGITFDAQLEEHVVTGDPPRIERAISNLLDNAAKWTPEGGVVEVSLEQGQLVVRDHGPGIDEDDLPFVFDRFYRSKTTRKQPGSGLGLAIVRKVAEDHRGWVSAENASGGGALMRFVLFPAAGAEPSPVPASVQPAHGP